MIPEPHAFLGHRVEIAFDFHLGLFNRSLIPSEGL